MPPRRNAEAATAGRATPAPAVGNVDAEDLARLVLHQEKLIQSLSDKVDALESSKADNPVPAQQAVYEPPVLREGYHRYVARFTEHTMMRVGEGYEMHGGQRVPVPIMLGKPIDFNGGVFETNNPDEIEFIENHPDFGTFVWEDSSAVRRHSNVEVVDGMKGTTSTPRVPLSAPMAP